MTGHGVQVDMSSTPARIAFDDGFNLSVAFLDRHLAAGRGDKPLARWIGGQATYAEVAANVGRMANALRELGVGPGERVMLFCKDTPAFYYGFLAAARIGAVAIPINYFLRRKDYAYMLADSGARAVLAFSDMLDEVAPALDAEGAGVDVRICCDASPDGWLGIDQLLGAASPDCAPHPTTPDSECFWLYSSGSTGAPKAAVHRHKDPIYTAVYYAAAVAGMREDDLTYSPSKLFFAYGLGNSLSFPLWAGATALLTEERPTAENTLDTISAARPDVYFGVPTLYAMQLAALEAGHKADLSSIRWAASGGEALPAPVYRAWLRRTGREIYDSIGSSEALHFYTANRPGQVKPGSAGRIIPGYEGRIVGEDGEPLPDGEIGQFVIRGESVAARYWNKPQKTAQTMRDGWLHTGDSCYRDEDGFYFFCGRDDDMMKVGGIWVSPLEIESALADHPAVIEAAVAAWPDEDGLDKPKAFVVLHTRRAAGEELRAELAGFVKQRLAPFKYPRWIEFLDELPKTASGKIQRFRLRPAGS